VERSVKLGIEPLHPAFAADRDATRSSSAIDVEIFNQEIWNRPGLDVLRLICERYLDIM
jgi:hypothetical protein